MKPLIDSYEAFVIDLDGVVYLQDEPIAGSAETLSKLSAAGRKFVLLTNNSAPTIQQYVEKLDRFDIKVSPQQIITSALAVRMYLEDSYETEGKTAFVIGQEGLMSELESTGLRFLTGKEGAGANFVFVGYDRKFDFDKLKYASMAIRRGAVYIACNTDSTYPTPQGLLPGAGSLVAAVTTASGREPWVAGKPYPFIVNAALERMDVKPEHTLLVGDRLDSDVEAGLKAGVDTLLVLTGVSTEEDVEKSGIRPTYVSKNLAGLFD